MSDRPLSSDLGALGIGEAILVVCCVLILAMAIVWGGR